MGTAPTPNETTPEESRIAPRSCSEKGNMKNTGHISLKFCEWKQSNTKRTVKVINLSIIHAGAFPHALKSYNLQQPNDETLWLVSGKAPKYIPTNRVECMIEDWNISLLDSY